MPEDMLRYIARRSKPAVCGMTEKEAIVPSRMVKPAISTLKKRGYRVIGTSYGKTKHKKIWYTGRIRL